MKDLTEALVKELIYYGKNGVNPFFKNEPIETIYFGGGTPSVLPTDDLSKIMDTIFKHYDVIAEPEITLEANPDDLNPIFLHTLKSMSVNRLSIGIQSFYEDHLRWMNRSHNATQALNCIEDALNAGISNLSIDLIYGFPGLTQKQWEANLLKVQSFPIQHLSCYGLTVEEKTPLHKLIETGRYKAPDADKAVKHFNTLLQWADLNLWDHYEISNFCRDGFFSKHNTGYWQQKKYLGVGPSAHSYNISHRRWNVKDNKQYVQHWTHNEPLFTEELLTVHDNLNDYILTSLRTKWGLDLHKASQIGGFDFAEKNKKAIRKYADLLLLEVRDQSLFLTQDGKLYADGIAREFFEI